MVRLQRPPIPASLAAAAPDATQALIDSWAGGDEPEVLPAIYNHPTIKTALRAAQHDKCAYCETRNPTSHDLVEHFRPKNGWRQTRQDGLHKPEYFWLGYAWENLLFACDRCNDRGHKENLFPLVNPAQRATAAIRDTGLEKPLLLNPYGTKDPEKHIAWDRDVPRPRNGSRYGRTTIATFRLDEDSLLLRERKRYLDDMEKSLDAIEALAADHPKRLAVRVVFQRYASNEEPWSAMIRANLGARIEAL
jgi:hypothetical protein